MVACSLNRHSMGRTLLLVAFTVAVVSARRHAGRSCWDDMEDATMPLESENDVMEMTSKISAVPPLDTPDNTASFLQTSAAASITSPPSPKGPGLDFPPQANYNWFQNQGKDEWTPISNLGSNFPTKGAGWENAFPGKGLDFRLWGPLLGEIPNFAGALFGRSLFSGCKCEACVYSIDTLINYLDEDTMGMFDEKDIDRILMDRFCYGIKWMYRSACHHIMSNYYEDVSDMIMTFYTGWDICRQVRFCPWFLNDPKT